MLAARIVCGFDCGVPATSTFSPVNGAGPVTTVEGESTTLTSLPSVACITNAVLDCTSVIAPDMLTSCCCWEFDSGWLGSTPVEPPPPHAERALVSKSATETRISERGMG
jgi:hypothetical protein